MRVLDSRLHTHFRSGREECTLSHSPEAWHCGDVLSGTTIVRGEGMEHRVLIKVMRGRRGQDSHSPFMDPASTPALGSG